MLKVTVEFGGKVLNTYTTDKDEFFIGRNKDNDIQIDNLAVSGRHAKIMKDNDTCTVEDLDSTNGTFVDNLKCPERMWEIPAGSPSENTTFLFTRMLFLEAFLILLKP